MGGLFSKHTEEEKKPINENEIAYIVIHRDPAQRCQHIFELKKEHQTMRSFQQIDIPNHSIAIVFFTTEHPGACTYREIYCLAKSQGHILQYTSSSTQETIGPPTNLYTSLRAH